MVDTRREINKIEDASKKAKVYCDDVLPFFDTIRYSADKLELVIDDKTWPLPKYREMLFMN
jgi:glutamine synthetase